MMDSALAQVVGFSPALSGRQPNAGGGMEVAAGCTCVERLADLVGLRDSADLRYDWEEIERSLGGVGLPRDYRALVETFPPGRFHQSISVIRPGDARAPATEYLGHYAYRLEDMRHARADDNDPAHFPYPIFPEPGGLLPWGVGRRGELLFWLTESPDPNKWDVVTADPGWTRWKVFPGTMCEFLVQLIAGRSHPIPSNGPISGYGFEPKKPKEGRPALGPVWATSYRQGSPVPGNDFPELSVAMPLKQQGVQPVDWASIEQALGLKFPSDYRSFVGTFGPGTFCDIMIAAPDPCEDVDLARLLIRKHEQAMASRRIASRTPFYPEPSGMIVWGEGIDGWTFGWGPNQYGPDQWGIVVARPLPDLGTVVHYPDLSFSGFLLRYVGQRGEPEGILDRAAWRGGITFVPHSHFP